MKGRGSISAIYEQYKRTPLRRGAKRRVREMKENPPLVGL